MRARQVGITDTTLRDGHQSLWATRMHTSEMIPVLELMDSIGFHSLECWGGATFDASLRFLDEDPWERLRLIKKHVARTPLQMLLRGQNIVGYRHYGDDIVRRFVYKAAENGMDVFRVFDALNDIRNYETAAAAIKETGKHFQGAVVYTISPVHSLDHYVDVAHKLVDMGADSICIKDMAALLSPFYAEQLVGRLKAELKVPIQLHCHYIGGLAPMTYLKAIEAGVDVIDTATVPLAFGNSQPATEMVVSALTGTPYDSGLDLEKLFEMAKYFEKVRIEGGWDRGVTSLTHMQVYSHQVPGGMISNLESQLKEQGALDRLPEVLEEIPIVRAEVGFPPLVTPMSQIVGTQAVLNVLSGRRWHIVPDEMKQYLRGKYGAAPGPVSQEVLSRVLEGEEPIGVRPADLVDETLEQYRAEIGELARSEEDLLSYALFPQTARLYLERHHVGPESDVFGVHDRFLSSQPGRGAARAERRPRQGHPRHDRGERGGRGRDRRGRPQDHRAQGRPRAGGRGGAGGAAAGRGGRAGGRRRGLQRLSPRQVQVGGDVLPLALAADAGVRRGGRRRRGRPDALHPRDDEDDERAHRRRGRRGPPDPRGERRDRAVRPAALRHRTRLRRGSRRPAWPRPARVASRRVATPSSCCTRPT